MAIKKIEISLDCENAAFDDFEGEVGQVLQRVTRQIQRHGPDQGTVTFGVRDTNGNSIGKIEMKE